MPTNEELKAKADLFGDDFADITDKLHPTRGQVESHDAMWADAICFLRASGKGGKR